MRARLPLLLSALLLSPLSARADGPSAGLAPLAARAADLKEQFFKKTAERETLKLEKACLDGDEDRANDTARLTLFERFEGVLGKIDDHLREGHAARFKALKELADKLRQDETKALENWRAAARARTELIEKQIDQETRLGVDLDRGSTASPWDEIALPITVAGVPLRLTFWIAVALAVSLLLGLHSARRPLRRWQRLRGRRGTVWLAVLYAALAVLAIGGLLAALGYVRFGGGTSPFAGAGPERLQKEVAGLGETCAQLEQALAKLDKEIPILTANVQGRRGVLLQLAADFLAPRLGERFRKNEEDALRQVHGALVASHVADAAAREGLEVVAQVEQQRQRFETTLARGQDDALARSGVRIGLACLLALAAFLPLGLIHWRLKRHQAGEAAKCPCCLKTDTMTEEEIYPPGGKAIRYVRCTCSYEFPAAYRKHPRLCFPTVGIPTSGKTHWLLTVYERIKSEQVPVAGTLAKQTSIADKEYDELSRLLLAKRQRPPGTQYGQIEDGKFLNWPLLFRFQEEERLLGGSSAMLNVFDFAGELVKREVFKDSLRQRALLMDSFILFLDPTQVDERAMYDLRLDDQIQALNDFKHDISLVREKEDDEPVRIPVAVCISKLDMTTTHNAVQNSARPWLKKLRETIGGELSLQKLQQRSDLCREILPRMFQGWEVVESLEKAFGGLFLFFPLSVVGLEESELGRDDLRHLDPFGVLEPILWLLHMHGYRVLE